MAEWKHITIDNEYIRTKTEKAALITMPHNSRYYGYQLWVPIRLVKSNFYGEKIIAYTDEFKFTLRKYADSRFKRILLDEIVITAEEFAEIFENADCYNLHETHIPPKLEAVKCEALEELRDE